MTDEPTIRESWLPRFLDAKLDYNPPPDAKINEHFDDDELPRSVKPETLRKRAVRIQNIREGKEENPARHKPDGAVDARIEPG